MQKKINVKNFRILRIPKHSFREKGDLLFGESGKSIPFPIRRFYVINHVPRADVERGMHAHKKLEQVILCLRGSAILCLDDGSTTARITLKDSNKGVWLGPGVWRVLRRFSADCVILVLASEYYKESDYIRDYEKFRSLYGANNRKKP